MPGAMFTVKEAAKICGVSRNTVYRRMPKLLEHGAEQNETGTLIPYSALVATGLSPRVAPPDVPLEQSQMEHGTTFDTPQRDNQVPLEQRIKQLESELEAAREEIHRLRTAHAVAEATASERNRIIEAQEKALQLITATREPLRHAPEPPEAATDPVVDSPAPDPTPTQPTPSRGIWNRLFGQ